MALIKCPECGKEISDKSLACIHCGYPLENIADNKPKLYKITLKMPGANKADTMKVVAQIMGTTVFKAKDIVDSAPKVIVSGITFDDSQAIAYKLSRVGASISIDEDADSHVQTTGVVEKMEERARMSAIASQPEKNIPKCPTCQSSNIKKISELSKVGSVAVWGVLAAGKVSKQWHCNNCGSEW